MEVYVLIFGVGLIVVVWIGMEVLGVNLVSVKYIVLLKII